MLGAGIAFSMCLVCLQIYHFLKGKTNGRMSKKLIQKIQLCFKAQLPHFLLPCYHYKAIKTWQIASGTEVGSARQNKSQLKGLYRTNFIEGGVR